MRPPFDDLDEFAFGDNAALSTAVLREQRKEERRYASRKPHDGPDDDEYLDDMDEYED